jgi:cytochrome oxidase assembly protein ShyY1
MSTPTQTSHSQSGDVSGWRRWVVYVVLTLVFAAACIALGVWQFDRRAQTITEIRRIENNYSATAIPIEDVLGGGQTFDSAQSWRPVRISGTYRPQDQMLVRNRTSDSGTGYEILTPLVTANGSVFIVDRGWIGRNESGDGPGAIPAPPAGDVQVVARLRPSEHSPLGQSIAGNLAPTIDVPLLTQHWGVPVYPDVYGLLVSENPSAQAGEPLAKPSTSEGNHLSYAFQWLAFAVLGFIALAWGIRREKKIRQSEPTQPTTKPLRRASDANVEDDIVDAAIRYR